MSEQRMQRGAEGRAVREAVADLRHGGRGRALPAPLRPRGRLAARWNYLHAALVSFHTMQGRSKVGGHCGALETISTH